MTSNTTLWFGHMNPQKPEFLESDYKQEEVVTFEVSQKIFSVGYELEELDDKSDPEAAKEAYRNNDDYPANRPSVPWLIDRVEIGDMIVVTPFGKDAKIRLLGKVSSDWKYRDDGLWVDLDTFNYVEVEDWVIITKEELPDYLEEYSARSTIQPCRKIEDKPEDMEELEELYKSRKRL
ncbi:MAG: hypothetical protein ABEJ03_01470 [Candidatus Nanohaloarchaea archaeon]